MDYRAAMQISAVGMTIEKTRLDVAALNLANMHVSHAPGTKAFGPMKVLVQAQSQAFGQWMNSAGAEAVALPSVSLVQTGAPARLERDPGHPHADAQGFVHYPGVDHAQEMLTAMTAMRAYEANVAAANMAKTMAVRALELGAQS
jgi:flagellar basal-body rod protein FlgC